MTSKSSTKPIVAVVDDETILLESWQEILADDFDTYLFSDGLAALAHFKTHSVDVAILNIRIPGMDGLSLLKELRKLQPEVQVLMVSGHGTVEMAVEALHLGAYDLITKPIVHIDAALRRVEAAVDRKRLRSVNRGLRDRIAAFGPQTRLIADHQKTEAIRQLIKQVANANAPVLICGESGTGKELAARALHEEGNREHKPFIAINCAAVSDTLIDSELFGHERGAFTGAVCSHKGLFEAADGGVLFLDEIGDVPLQTQVKLLRALQEG
jgi:DNA-binding NtrC family response regulator